MSIYEAFCFDRGFSKSVYVYYKGFAMIAIDHKKIYPIIILMGIEHSYSILKTFILLSFITLKTLKDVLGI